jgi:hypothetical protein
MREKLPEYALIAEIIGAMAVVISLIYVGVSLGQNTAAIEVANHQAIVAMDSNKNTWLRDADFAVIYENARSDFGKLSKVDSRQYLTFVADTMNAWEFAFITHENGAMADNIWHGWDGFYRSEFETEGFQNFWKLQGDGFSPEFVTYLEMVLPE